MDILYRNRHHLADPCLTLVAHDTDRTHEVLAKLSLDIAQDRSYHIVLQRYLAILLYKLTFCYLPECIRVGHEVTPLVAIAVHEASPQFAASLIKSIPTGSAFVKEFQSYTRFPFVPLSPASGDLHSFIKKFIHFTKLLDYLFPLCRQPFIRNFKSRTMSRGPVKNLFRSLICHAGALASP